MSWLGSCFGFGSTCNLLPTSVAKHTTRGLTGRKPAGPLHRMLSPSRRDKCYANRRCFTACDRLLRLLLPPKPPGTYVPVDLASHPIDTSDLEEAEEGEQEEPEFAPVGQAVQQPDEGVLDVLDGGARVAQAAEAMQEALGREGQEQQEAVAGFQAAVEEQLALLEEEYRIANEEAEEAAAEGDKMVFVNPDLARRLLGMLHGEDRAAGPVYVAGAVLAEDEGEQDGEGEQAPPPAAAAAGGAGKGKGKGRA